LKPYTIHLCRQHHGSAFGWTIPTKHHSRQQKPFWTPESRYDCYI